MAAANIRQNAECLFFRLHREAAPDKPGTLDEDLPLRVSGCRKVRPQILFPPVTSPLYFDNHLILAKAIKYCKKTRRFVTKQTQCILSMQDGSFYLYASEIRIKICGLGRRIQVSFPLLRYSPARRRSSAISWAYPESSA